MEKNDRQIEMRMVEAYVGGIKCLNMRFVVAIHLGGLPWDAASCPLANILLQAIPSQTFHEDANGDPCGWMGEIVKAVEDFSSERNGNNKSWNASTLEADDLVQRCCNAAWPVLG